MSWDMEDVTTCPYDNTSDAERYRSKALRYACSRIEYFDGEHGKCKSCAIRMSGGDASYGYCDAVLREVDGK